MWLLITNNTFFTCFESYPNPNPKLWSLAMKVLSQSSAERSRTLKWLCQQALGDISSSLLAGGQCLRLLFLLWFLLGLHNIYFSLFLIITAEATEFSCVFRFRYCQKYFNMLFSLLQTVIAGR